MKKLFCLLIVTLLFVQCAAGVCAQEWTDSVSPYVDMEVRANGVAAFENGPLNLRGGSAVVDYKTTLEMAPVLNKFVQWYDYAVNIINNLVSIGGDEATLMGRLGDLAIDGQFEIKIEYPNTFLVPQAFIAGGNMYGFNDEAKEIFYERSRVLTAGAQNNVLTITVGVKGSETAVLKAQELYANKEAYLADIVLTAEGVTVPMGTHTVRGTLTGYTTTQGTVSNNLSSLRVDYTGVQPEDRANPAEAGTISATVNLTKLAPQGAGSPTESLVFNVDGNTSLILPINRVNVVKLDELPYPTKPGYTFDGWYYDSAFTKKVEGDVNVTGRTVLYGHFVSDTLNSEDHFAYIIGYPDGTVRPSNYISREEVTTVFYRLLRESKTIGLSDDENTFTDVSADRWSCKAILSMANGGYVKGYEDGSFRPANYITRAEFATMATRYALIEGNKDLSFSDVAGHWAEEYINKAASAGWVTGYEDGSFGPEKYITRAEVMTIINRMLVRYVDAEGLHADTRLWTDMDGSEWYYYNVLEATNAHDYERKEDGKYETWTEITPNKVWIELDEMENPDA